MCRGIIESFDMIINCDRYNTCFAWNVAADHKHNTELTECVGERKNDGAYETANR